MLLENTVISLGIVLRGNQNDEQFISVKGYLVNAKKIQTPLIGQEIVGVAGKMVQVSVPTDSNPEALRGASEVHLEFSSPVKLGIFDSVEKLPVIIWMGY